jgi:hypothetical protein
MNIKLNFLKKDFKETNYTDVYDCAITRALQRAGIDAIDVGIGITSSNTLNAPGKRKMMSADSNTDYCELASKVQDMYLSIPAEDFEYTLDLDL